MDVSGACWNLLGVQCFGDGQEDRQWQVNAMAYETRDVRGSAIAEVMQIASG
jgi:hypothetical protein